MNPAIVRATVRELECFVAVAEELNFSRAARRLHISQPPLTRQIQSLEEKLALRLFQRSTRAVSLTPAGALYLEDARGILMRLDGATEAARRAGTGESSRLRLAFIGALLDEGLVRLLQLFRDTHPGCQIHLTDLSAAAQFEALRAGQIDGAFIGAPPQGLTRDMAALVWKEEPLLIALPDRHPLAGPAVHNRPAGVRAPGGSARRSTGVSVPGSAARLTFAALKAEGWVMISRNAAPAFRQQFDGLCSAAGFRPRVVQESDRVAAVLTMVAAGQGISLLPEAVTRLIREGVVFHPVRGKGLRPVLAHTFLYRARKPDPMVADFVKLLRASE